MNKILLTLCGVLVGALIGWNIGVKMIENPVGSVDRNSTYKSTNMLNLTGSSSVGTLIKTGPATIGSVVFTATSAQTITLYDVAAGTNFASTTLSTKIISFATSTPAGTYTIDAQVFKGLVVQNSITPTVEGVITWR